MSHARDIIALADGRSGFAVIRDALRTMPAKPGVYRMLSARGEALYVGKARDLRKRVATYASAGRLSTRLMRMIAQTAALEITITHTEAEALLLEANLIKRLKPRYNILLRDDKSFPYILLRRDHAWPQLVKHRGARGRDGDYFGPFASAGAVNQTLHALQRAFPLRTCTDGVFASRTRPCLEHQIKRCSAPCVGRISATDYEALVAEARAFLSGRTRRVQESLAQRMEAASAALDFETAAVFRDRIRALTQIQASQDINVAGLGEADVVAVHQEGGHTCVEVVFFRAGHHYGNRAYFPAQAARAEAGEVVAAFLGQFYQARAVPKRILVSHRPAEHALLEEALAVHAGHRVHIRCPRRGEGRRLVMRALDNARSALARRLAEASAQRRLLEGLAERLGLAAPPTRIEVYDNSHLQGANAVAGMIVAGPDGFVKAAYRKFTIKGEGATSGDDYAMMGEVLRRRFQRLVKDDPERAGWPDLVLVDGGAGQLAVACAVLEELAVRDVAVAAVAKGPDRNAGRERVFLPGKPPLALEARDPVLYFIQRLRDEAHRFAIGTHRARRGKAGKRSALDAVPGVGAVRKRALLRHFGSAQAVAEAGVADLARVDGISHAVAKSIYAHFHADGA